MNTTQTRNIIAKVLKEMFPETKFKIAAKNHNWGATLNIDWNDGPVESQLWAVLGSFEGSKSSHCGDYREWSGNATYYGDEELKSFEFVHIRRRNSEQRTIQAMEAYNKKYGWQRMATPETMHSYPFHGYIEQEIKAMDEANLVIPKKSKTAENLFAVSKSSGMPPVDQQIAQQRAKREAEELVKILDNGTSSRKTAVRL